jgi:uncharacterized protein (DUF1810 family)
MPQADPSSLERFVLAQAPVFDGVLAELGSGRKRSHWMWFIFPQLRGLGLSSTSQYYGVASVNEARAYLASHSWTEAGTLHTRCASGRRPHLA